MTLLSICQAAAATAPIAIPTAIVGSADETAQLLLGLANDAGDDIARRPTGGWVSMMREYDFQIQAIAPTTGTIQNVNGLANITGIAGASVIVPGLWVASGTGVPNNALVTAVNTSLSGAVTIILNQAATTTGTGSFEFGQANYLLPGDFQRPIDNTFWDRTRFWSMRGPQSPQQWQLYKSSVIGRASIQRRYRFRSITLTSALGIGQGGIGIGGAGGAVGVQQCLSIDPFPFDGGSQLVFEYVSNAWCQSATGAPQSSWQADTDTGIIDEYLLRLSVKYRLLRRLGLAYSEELNEFEAMLDKALAHDGGGATLDLTPNNNLSLIGPWNLPETGFGGVLS